MLHSRSLNDKINCLHERVLRIVYSDYKSSFNTLLEMDGSYSIPHRNIQRLPVEIYKFLNGICYGRHFKTQQAYYIQPKNLPETI